MIHFIAAYDMLCTENSLKSGKSNTFIFLELIRSLRGSDFPKIASLILYCLSTPLLNSKLLRGVSRYVPGTETKQ